MLILACKDVVGEASEIAATSRISMAFSGPGNLLRSASPE